MKQKSQEDENQKTLHIQQIYYTTFDADHKLTQIGLSVDQQFQRIEMHQ